MATQEEPKTPDKDVTLTVSEVVCGEQEVTIGGEYVYEVSVKEDYLEIKVDGTQVNILNVTDEADNWPNWTYVTTLGVGTHTFEVNLYDSNKDGLGGLITTKTGEVTIEECPTPVATPTATPKTPETPVLPITGAQVLLLGALGVLGSSVGISMYQAKRFFKKG